jgi:hypothetical protein
MSTTKKRKPEDQCKRYRLLVSLDAGERKMLRELVEAWGCSSAVVLRFGLRAAHKKEFPTP